MDELKVIEFFGGIGACTQAFKRIGIPFKVVDYVEIDKNAVKSYNAMNNTNFMPQDISQWDKDLDVDFIMHGSPCQDFSMAGKQAGGDKGSDTRSSLMYETIRVVQKLMPKYVLWENVENLLGDKHIHNYYNYLETLNSLGYKNYYRVLNSKDYGIPQSRNRIFTLSILGDIKFEFPKEQVLGKTFYDLLDDEYDPDQVVLTEKDLTMVKDFGAPYSFGGFIVRDDLYPTITASYGKISGNSGKIRCKEGFRILTPHEAWKFMGFSDDNYEKASQVNGPSALYKQAGNSIVVDILEALLASLFNIQLDKKYRKQQKQLF